MNTLAGKLAVEATAVIEAQATLIGSLQTQLTAAEAFVPDAEDTAAETALQAAVDAANAAPPTGGTPPAAAQKIALGPQQRPPVVTAKPAPQAAHAAPTK